MTSGAPVREKPLPDLLRRWADARDRRLAAGGNAGKTGTQLLRDAAAWIEELERDNEHAYSAWRELTEGDVSRG